MGAEKIHDNSREENEWKVKIVNGVNPFFRWKVLRKIYDARKDGFGSHVAAEGSRRLEAIEIIVQIFNTLRIKLFK